MAAKKGDRAAAGCLALFALPFAAVGVFGLYLASSTLWTWTRMQGWVEAPAQIQSLDLEEHTATTPPRTKSAQPTAIRSAARDFSGDRVAVSGMADNIGSFHQDLYARLRGAGNEGATTTAYVDPAEPTPRR